MRKQKNLTQSRKGAKVKPNTEQPQKGTKSAKKYKTNLQKVTKTKVCHHGPIFVSFVIFCELVWPRLNLCGLASLRATFFRPCDLLRYQLG
jgi:hypothetical protein